MRYLLSFLTLVFLTMAMAGTAMALPTLSRMTSKLNQNVVPSDGGYFRLGDQLVTKKFQVMKVTYDASKNGATGYPLKYTGVHQLKDVDGTAATIPSGALITSAWLDVKNSTSAVTNLPRICFQLQSGCDIYGDRSLWQYNATGESSFKFILPVDGTTKIKLTADRIVQAVVSGGALTGGTMNLFIEYLISN